MKRHWHTGVEVILVGAIGTAVVFHGFRFVAARLAPQPGLVGKIGEAMGGLFTFGGNS